MNVGRSIVHDVTQTVYGLQQLSAAKVPRIVEGLQNQGLRLSPMDYKKEIGRRIKLAREEKGWILEDLQRKTDDVLSVSRISNYEQGTRMPGPSEAVILAKALGKRAAWIMAVDDAQLPISLLEEALIRNWRTLTERDRMEFVREIELKAMQSRDPVPDQKVMRTIGPAPSGKGRKYNEKPEIPRKVRT